MAHHSKIEWTETTWNPVTGCNKVSPGCEHCYAERLSKRLRAMRNPRYAQGFELCLHPDIVDRPLHWKKPRLVFVNSMSDLFHEDVPLEFIQRIFNTMNNAPWHTFQVLTKRSSRLASISSELTWSENIWMGVSVENQNYVYRIDNLLQTQAHVRFASFEPLLGPILTPLISRLDWAIVGGESGPKARAMEYEWVINIRDECLAHEVPFFFKQWGGVQRTKAGRVLDGITWDEMPIPRADSRPME